MLRLPVPINYRAIDEAMCLALTTQSVNPLTLELLIEKASKFRGLPVYCWKSAFVATGDTIYAHSSFLFDQLMLGWAIAVEQFKLQKYREAAGTVRFIYDYILPFVAHRRWPIGPPPPEFSPNHYEPVYTLFSVLARNATSWPASNWYLYIARLWQTATVSSVFTADENVKLLFHAFSIRFSVVNDLYKEDPEPSRLASALWAILRDLDAVMSEDADEKLKKLHGLVKNRYNNKELECRRVSFTPIDKALVLDLGNREEEPLLIADNSEQAFLALFFCIQASRAVLPTSQPGSDLRLQSTVTTE
jgi:hypothetical protein